MARIPGFDSFQYSLVLGSSFYRSNRSRREKGGIRVDGEGKRTRPVFLTNANEDADHHQSRINEVQNVADYTLINLSFCHFLRFNFKLMLLAKQNGMSTRPGHYFGGYIKSAFLDRPRRDRGDMATIIYERF